MFEEYGTGSVSDRAVTTGIIHRIQLVIMILSKLWTALGLFLYRRSRQFIESVSITEFAATGS